MADLFLRGKTYYSKLMIGGKEVRRALSTNKEIAQERLLDLIKQQKARRHGHLPTNARWEPFKEELLKASRLNKKRDTWQAEERAYRELEAVISVKRIDQITPRLLEEIVKPAWIGKKRGKYVINRDLRTIRGAMRKAEAYGYVARQDWTINKYLKTPKGRLTFWTLGDLNSLRQVCTGIWKTLLYLGARAGLRLGEIRALPWTEVDFERNKIHIVANDLWAPKSFERRYVPMAPDLRDYLLSIKSGRPFVFQDADGHRPKVDSMSTYFRRLVRKAGLKGSVHTLRHSFAGHLVSNGLPLRVLQSWMGHSSTKTTEIYAHLAPGSGDEMVRLMPSLAQDHHRVQNQVQEKSLSTEKMSARLPGQESPTENQNVDGCTSSCPPVDGGQRKLTEGN